MDKKWNNKYLKAIEKKKHKILHELSILKYEMEYADYTAMCSDKAYPAQPKEDDNG